MRVKKLLPLLILTALAAAPLVLLAQQAGLQSAWTAVSPAVDGKDDEWAGLELFTDKKSGARYTFRNDGRNLYLFFFFETPMAMSTIEATGMKVYYSLDGKKNKDLGVHFIRKEVSGDELIKSIEKEGEILSQERKDEIKKRQSYLIFQADIINKKKAPAPSDPSVMTDRPVFRFAPKKRSLVCEFRIPLSRTNQPGGIGIQPGQSFTVGFEWGGMTKEMVAAQMARRAEQSSQASARGTSIESAISGGDEHVDSSGGPSGYRPDSRAKKHSFWVKIQLAQGAK